MTEIVKLAKRLYECTKCGNQVETQTNHRGEIYPTCTGKCRQIINPHTENEKVFQAQTAHKFVKDL